MRVAYISGPYRAGTFRGVIENIRKAEAVAIELWEMGYAVICPHTNTALFPEGAGEPYYDEQQYKVIPPIDYIKGDLEIISRLVPRSDVIIMLPGWKDSEGSKSELHAAMARSLKICFWPQDKEILGLTP